MKAWIGVAAFLLFLGLSCTPRPSAPSRDLTPAQAQQWLQQKDAPYLLDVREPDEYQAEHLAGSVLIPLGELERRSRELPKDRPLLLYCHSGRRSQKAEDLLRQEGFKDLHQLVGGITAWKAAGFPVLSTAVPEKPTTSP